MKKLIRYARLSLILPLAVVLAAYATIINGQLMDDYYIGSPRVLVDSSRDGGIWWSPQPFVPGVFDPSLEHQGKPLADYLRSLGMEVEELPRPYEITPELLEDYDLVIRANTAPNDDYTSDEIDAYLQYVDEGGRLILIAEYSDPGDPDVLALAFGLNLQDSFSGLVEPYADHPITAGVAPFYYSLGSILIEDSPPGTTELGFLGPDVVMGVLPFGLGQVFFIGDSKSLLSVLQPLTDNLIVYFLTAEGLASQIMEAELEPQAENALLNKLDAAMVSLDKGQYGAYINKLEAFINQIAALERSGKIDAMTAESLIGAALGLIENIDQS